MKKVFPSFIALLFANVLFAQKPARITDETVVKDTAGQVLPASVWKTFLSSGKYVIRPENPTSDGTAFIIRRLSDEEIRRRLANAPKPRESGYFVTGRSPANFSGKDLQGNKYKLKDLSGKVVVLNFWFVNCGPCRTEIPELNKIVEEYKDSSDIVFLAVALDDESDILQFIKQSPFDYKIISNGRYITETYGIRSYPTHAILDKAGKVVFHTSGLGNGTIPWIRKMIADALK